MASCWMYWESAVRSWATLVWDIAHGVQCAPVPFEEHLLGVFTEETAQTAMHGLLLCSSKILAEGHRRQPHISQIYDKMDPMKHVALYMRVSTVDQHPETQLLDLRQLASQRGFEIVQEYTDRLSGVKARRPGLDHLMADARRGKFDVILVWAFDRIARSVVHFLQVLDELNHLGVEFVSFREQIDTGGPLGRAIIVIIGAIAELERSLIVERVRAGMRRARLEGTHIGRRPLDLDRSAIVRDRQHGQSLGQITRSHCASRATIHRIIQAEMPANHAVSKGC